MHTTIFALALALSLFLSPYRSFGRSNFVSFCTILRSMGSTFGTMTWYCLLFIPTNLCLCAGNWLCTRFFIRYRFWILDPRATHTVVTCKNYTNEDDMYGVTWMYFPDGNGTPQIAYLTEESSRSHGGRGKDVKEHVRFELYTK